MQLSRAAEWRSPSTAKSWSEVLLRFIARLAIHLKELLDAEREHALAEPWTFPEVVEDVRTSTDQKYRVSLTASAIAAAKSKLLENYVR